MPPSKNTDLDLNKEVKAIQLKKEEKINITLPMTKADQHEIDLARRKFGLKRAEFLRLAVIFALNSEDFENELKKFFGSVD